MSISATPQTPQATAGDKISPIVTLVIRRLIFGVGVYLAQKGVISCPAGGDMTSCAGISNFVGAAMILGEVGVEAWNRYGMVLIGAGLARFHGLHQGQQLPKPKPPTAPDPGIAAQH